MQGFVTARAFTGRRGRVGLYSFEMATVFWDQVRVFPWCVRLTLVTTLSESDLYMYACVPGCFFLYSTRGQAEDIIHGGGGCTQLPCMAVVTRP